MYRKLTVTAAAAIAASASAQTELVIDICEPTLGHWVATAYLFNPESEVLATIADLEFELGGTGFDNFRYNPAFDSEFFGPADVLSLHNRVEFRGFNALPPLNNHGGPDSSNPLVLFELDAHTIDSFSLVGQVNGAYVNSPFPTIITYQTSSGAPGDVPYLIRIFSFSCLPTPGSFTVLGFALPLGMRRQRKPQCV